MGEKALLVGAIPVRTVGPFKEDSLDELAQLTEAAGVQPVTTIIQRRHRLDPAYLVGKGKAEEIASLCSLLNINAVIFGNNLAPRQVQNLERVIGVKVIDRTELILDIFAQRAKSQEGKFQVELAQLRYLLSRLIGKGVLLSRLGGGVGTRGPGETQLEMERRRIRERIKRLEREVKTIRKTRHLHRKGRQENRLATIALVGYTNSGKSTLFNKLTSARVLVSHRLFSTLDPTVRLLPLPHKHAAYLCDTVGFIRQLPHHLIEAFKATLEEVIEADILMHVIDASSPHLAVKRASVLQVLEELSISSTPLIEVYNKVDLLSKGEKQRLALSENTSAIGVSALTGEGIAFLKQRVEAQVYPVFKKVYFAVPYTRGDILSMLHRESSAILQEQYKEEYVTIEAEIDQGVLLKLGNSLSPFTDAVRK